MRFSNCRTRSHRKLAHSANRRRRGNTNNADLLSHLSEPWALYNFRRCAEVRRFFAPCGLRGIVFVERQCCHHRICSFGGALGAPFVEVFRSSRSPHAARCGPRHPLADERAVPESMSAALP